MISSQQHKSFFCGTQSCADVPLGLLEPGESSLLANDKPVALVGNILKKDGVDSGPICVGHPEILGLSVRTCFKPHYAVGTKGTVLGPAKLAMDVVTSVPKTKAAASPIAGSTISVVAVDTSDAAGRSRHKAEVVLSRTTGAIVVEFKNLSELGRELRATSAAHGCIGNLHLQSHAYGYYEWDFSELAEFSSPKWPRLQATVGEGIEIAGSPVAVGSSDFKSLMRIIRDAICPSGATLTLGQCGIARSPAVLREIAKETGATVRGSRQPQGESPGDIGGDVMTCDPGGHCSVK